MPLRDILSMDTVQIETCTTCRFDCANCSRFRKHYPEWIMPLDQFKQAVDSLEGYPEYASEMQGKKPIGPYIGMTGGDPVLHPQFEEMCEYLRSKFPKEQCGLWTTLPPGKEEYREIICDTFHSIFVNDHSREDIEHHPFLCSIEEFETNPIHMWCRINNCWAQHSWSASINPKGAWFCEMAGAQAMLVDGDGGWPVKKGWWVKMPWDFKSQVEKYCPHCGGPSMLQRRSSKDKVDDISPKNLERLRGRSKKIQEGRYVISDLKPVDPRKLKEMAAYKDFAYRNAIATRYGMFLTINEQGFWTPHLRKHKGERDFVEAKPIYEIFKERWAQHA